MSKDLIETTEDQFGGAYAALDRFFIPRIRDLLPDWVTPDGISYFRTVMAIPMSILAFYQPWDDASLAQAVDTLEPWLLSFALFVATYLPFCLLDYADGLVARAKKMVSEFGAFLDAMCDKGVFILLALGGGIQLDYSLPLTLILPLVTIFVLLMAGEIHLGIVRIEDWRHNQRSAACDTARRDLKAKPSGKWKFCLELTAAGGLLYANPAADRLWPLSVALVCGALALPYLWRSLRQKLAARL